MKEKLQEFALIAEIISGVAIVITLVILVFEVRDNTDALEISNRQSIALRGQELAVVLIENPIIGQAQGKLRQGEVLTISEAAAFGPYINANLRLTEEAYKLYQNNQLAAEDWETRKNVMLNLLSSNTARSIFAGSTALGYWDEDFKNYLSQALNETSGDQ